MLLYTSGVRAEAMNDWRSNGKETIDQLQAPVYWEAMSNLRVVQVRPPPPNHGPPPQAGSKIAD